MVLSTLRSSMPAVILLALLLSASSRVVDGSIRIAVDVKEEVDVGIHAGTTFGTGQRMSKRTTILSYSVVNEWNKTLFEGGDLAVFMSGKWCVTPSRDSILRSSSEEGNFANDSTSSRPLIIEQQESVNGTTPGLGSYEGIRIRWSCVLQESTNEAESDSQQNIPIITSFLNFDSEQAVVFDIEYPEGAKNTSLVRFQQRDGDTATLATFPSFAMNDPSATIAEEKNNRAATETISYVSSTLPSFLSWKGSFVQSVRELSTGPTGGPTVFYNASDPTLATVVVSSPFFDVFDRNDNRRHHFNEFTAGNNKDWTGTVPSFSPGRSGRLTKIPSGGSQSILLYQGSNGGITSTIQEWGTIMQTSSVLGISNNGTSNLANTPTQFAIPSPTSTPLSTSRSKLSQAPPNFRLSKLEDVTLERIGYQTDNGAMYCFCSEQNCSEVLLDEKDYLDSIGIPIGYLSFQGAGTSSGRGKAAPWCVDKWSADGGQNPNNYPLDMRVFQEALGVPLQLYAPYFCPNSTGYFRPETPWKSVTSNPELPGCSGFAFENVHSSDSKDFYKWFLSKGIENGAMASFESDFMNQNVNCVEEFVEDPIHGADEFLQGMADAALGFGVPIQWCYASPNVVMSSLNFPAVTNFRVSFDYCYGRSYDIGESSLLVWAMGASPSKDTLWTTNNNHTETPGCEWTDDHEIVAAELHVVLSIMSTGPVGISDGIGMTNVTLLQRIISKDGSLLQPSKPITAVDSSFLEDDSAPDGYLYGTHGLDFSWIFVSFQLNNPFPVTMVDFWPPPGIADSNDHSASSTGKTSRLVHRTFGSSPDCIEREDAISSGCVTLVTLEMGSDDLGNSTAPIFVAPQSSFEFPGSDLSPNVVTVWKECPGSSGIFFLGELDKYVALSKKRFRSVDCSDEGVSATLLGSFGEIIVITLLIPREGDWYEVMKYNITVLDPDGFARFDYRPRNVVHPEMDVVTN